MRRHPLLAFFGLTFAITWGIGAAVIVLDEPLAALLGPMDLRAPLWKPIWHTAVYGPAISAFIVIAAMHGGAGVRAYARRLVNWRVGLGWYALVLLGYTALKLSSRAIANAVGSEDVPLIALDRWDAILPLFLITLVDDPGPMEEIGWRGFALPMLQQHFSAFTASLILGLVWGVWHLPAFYIAATPQSGFVFPVFVLGSVVLALLMTSIYNSTRGNVLLMFLMHAVINFDYGVEAQSTQAGMLATAVLGLAVVIPVIVWKGRERMGSAKVTDVLPPA